MAAVAAAVDAVDAAHPRLLREAEAARRPPLPSPDIAAQLEAVAHAAVGLLAGVAPPPLVEEDTDKVEGEGAAEEPHVAVLVALRKSSLPDSRCSSNLA